ncbi:MAG TPA: Gfo/Idh/MocA family oxidoreductase [Actinomycetota bacterium]|nr:Gfo/Idh/MocA family oxidoreductase [Actinomycetota bacterium]
MSRLPVGVVGCGLIAQVMHLPHLRKLADRYEVVALCDVSPGTVEAVGEAFGVERRFTSIDDLLEAPIEAVLILTSGNHAPAAIRAAASGRHVFVEKPICLRVSDGLELTTVARRSSVRIMAGYMKRHDPAFARFRDELDRTRDVRLVTFATMESPEAPYLAHHRVLRAPAPEPAVQAELRAMREADDRLVEEAIGSQDGALIGQYCRMILASMVHDLNLVRAILGEPDTLEFASIRPQGVTAVLRVGTVQAVLTWVDLPGIARYRQEFAALAPERRIRLEFPSPYLRHAPTRLAVEEGRSGTSRSWLTSEIVSYEESFELELIEFHAAIEEGREPTPEGLDGVRDVALAEAIAASHLDGMARERPTEMPVDASR